jgi:pantoate--beta-alanine ligase
MTMEAITGIPLLRERVHCWRRDARRVALVATMGNLHPGHMELVRQARTLADRVAVSIFVNPLQFGPDEDYAAYPRTPEEDRAMLEQAGVEVLFMPEASHVYPADAGQQTLVEVPGFEDILCGASRPGHFAGVATVVAKLFNLVLPDVALFGEKDYQQLLLIRKMVRDLCFPVEIVAVPVVREVDGLAMSSRNRYLLPAERTVAPLLYRTLLWVRERLQARDAVPDALAAGRERLRHAGFRLDYLELRDAGDLRDAAAAKGSLRLLAAVFLGTTRLIDNIAVDIDPEEV